jgi:CheY-like chemotaxis protein
MARVGLLEDNIRIAKLSSTMLHHAGHQVILYEHARDCMQALVPEKESRRGKLTATISTLPVDLLILDLHLPEVTGLEVLCFLREHAQTRELPLIFCTAATPSEIETALRITPHAIVIEKPFTFQALVNAVSYIEELNRNK